MQTQAEKIAQAQDYLRQAFALLAEIQAELKPNVRSEIAKTAIPTDLQSSSHDLSLATPVPPPGPVVPVEPEIPRIPPAPELDE